MRLDRNKDGYITRQEASGTRLSGGVHRAREMGKRPPAIKSAGLLYVDTHNHLVGRRKSDETIKPANNHPSAGSIRSTVSLLDQLPPKLKARIGHENAYRLYKLKNNTCDEKGPDGLRCNVQPATWPPGSSFSLN